LNPDTQIQSSLEGQANQQNEGLSAANCGEVRQNPQYSRNKIADVADEGNESEDDTLP
jgi:hypothetical protein